MCMPKDGLQFTSKLLTILVIACKFLEQKIWSYFWHNKETHAINKYFALQQLDSPIDGEGIINSLLQSYRKYTRTTSEPTTNFCKYSKT